MAVYDSGNWCVGVTMTIGLPDMSPWLHVSIVKPTRSVLCMTLGIFWFCKLTTSVWKYVFSLPRKWAEYNLLLAIARGLSFQTSSRDREACEGTHNPSLRPQEFREKS